MSLVDDDLMLVANELRLAGDFPLVGHRKYLINNDLYFVKSIKVRPEWKNENVGYQMMKCLPQWLMRITHDGQPVIAVIPSKENIDYHDLGYAPAFPGTITMVHAK